MDWARSLLDVVAWSTPAALAVVAVGSRDLQRLVLPGFAGLILVVTLTAVSRYWPRRDA